MVIISGVPIFRIFTVVYKEHINIKIKMKRLNILFRYKRQPTEMFLDHPFFMEERVVEKHFCWYNDAAWWYKGKGFP